MMHAPLRRATAATRATATTAIAALLASALVMIVPTTPAAVAAPLPAGSETFDVSRSDGGAVRNPFLTADAQRVAFTSTASDLVTGDANGVADIFLATAEQGSEDPFSRAPILVSAPDGAVGAVRANGDSDHAVASIDGRYVAFTSAATNLTDDPSAGDGRTYVYVRDTVKNTTLRVQGAAEPNGASWAPDLSDSGRRLVFTSDADNLSTDGLSDTNARTDSYVVDLDTNGDGTVGDLTIQKIFADQQVEVGTHDAVISGNGYVVGVLIRATSPARPWFSDGSNLHAVTFDPDELIDLGGARFVDGAILGRVSIDATGKAFAYVMDNVCAGQDAVVAATASAEGRFMVAVGSTLVDMQVGTVSDPVISPDASTVAWTTTVPEHDDDVADPEPLAEPVVRLQAVAWADASGQDNVQCAGTSVGSWYDIADGSTPALSASGRTVAFATTGDARIHAVDRHSHDGLAVSDIQGRMVAPGYITKVPIANISLASLRGYAAALADAPIHRLPIHRLPIHRLPIHRLPIHRLDLPGGWDQVLEGSPFAGALAQTVTLDAVLEWAAANPTTDAGTRIRSLTLDDVDIDDTGLDALSLASYALGDAPVAELPIPGDEDSPTAYWQGLVAAQGIDVAVDDGTVLADLDAAGLDIAATGIEQLMLSALPDDLIDDTLLEWMTIDPALIPGTPLADLQIGTLDPDSRTALFDSTDVTGTLGAPSRPLLPTATFGDLAKGAQTLSFGSLLFSLLDARSYPWEQIAPSAIDPAAASVGSAFSCVGGDRCSSISPYRFAFDAGPGEPTWFAAPTASVTLPAGTKASRLWASGSGPGGTWTDLRPYEGAATISGSLVTFPLSDTPAGTVLELSAEYGFATTVGDARTRATLTSGTQSAESRLFGEKALDTWDNPLTTWSPTAGFPQENPVELIEGILYYDWISPAWLDDDEDDDETGARVQGPADDEDYYTVAAPPAGKRLVVSTNASDGQLSLSLFRPQGNDTTATTLGLESAGPVPGTAVTEQGLAGTPSEAGADAGVQLAGQTLLDQAVQGGTDTAEVVAASTESSAGTQLLVRVASGNGKPSESLYSLRVQYIDEPVDTVCTSFTPTLDPAVNVPGTSDVVTDDTNTLYLLDTQRYDETYGIGSAAAVRAGLATLTGTGDVGGDTVQGAVLSVDDSPSVRAARSVLDANPCSLSARRALTAEINASVAAFVDGHRDRIRSVVIIGGDDIIPLAPVAQHTSQFTERSHASALRLTETAAGPCPTEVADGALDACATPLSAAAAASEILTDDPYGLARAYESLGGHLYVPTTALGRLAQSPDATIATIDRFVDVDGVLDADSTLTGGYGAWSELPDDVTSALSWRSATNTELGADGTLWDADDMTSALFPDAGEGPRVVSINTHADERVMLPGIEDAADGAHAPGDLFTTDDAATDAEALAGSLVFLIGCHAGNNLPSAYYGDEALDWVDVFSHAGGYVGNTGFGLANDVTTALGERLLGLYAGWIGAEVDGRKVSASEALTYAKQSYLGGLGLYSGYDEKVLMEAVYYGLPMYTFSDAATTKSAPIPEIPEALQALATSADGLSTASLSLSPSFQKRTVQDAAGHDVSYLVADGEDPAVVAGQPVLPKLVAQLRAEDDLTPRGVLITGLTSQVEGGVTPAIAQPGIGVPESTANRTDAAFPSSFATITRQDAPEGPIDLLVVTPGRVQAPLGAVEDSGAFERFTHLDLDIVYGDEQSTDATAPAITGIDTADGFRFTVDGTGSDVARGILLVQREGDEEWQRLPATITAAGAGTVTLDDDDRPYRWILQVADAAGNVAVDTNRGRLDPQDAAPPTLADSGRSEVVALDGTLTRSVEVVDARTTDRFTGRLVVRAKDTGDVALTAVVPVETSSDAKTRARISQRFGTPGTYTATLTVCQADSCSDVAFDVEVPLPNAAPTASVTLASDTNPVRPTSVLTAHANGEDADGDTVTLGYAWTRNGAPLSGQHASTLDLGAVGAAAADVIVVIVTPSDPSGTGHGASAALTVPVPPAPPQISAVATNTAGAYVEGTWSRTAVTVTFTCAGATALRCTAPQTISVDTDTSGIVVTGTVTDLLGRSASVSLLVRLDRTPPALRAIVTPNPVAQGATATVTPTASDAASGLGPVTCATPQTAVPGPSTVVCSAADIAGNTATAAAAYTVLAPAARLCRGLLDRTALSPLNADGTSVFLRTSGVPILFRACDAAGKSITTKGTVKSVTLVGTASLPSSAKINELWYLPLTGFAYLKPADIWLGQISTATLARGKKYTYKVLLADGTSFTFTFGVK